MSSKAALQVDQLCPACLDLAYSLSSTTQKCMQNNNLNLTSKTKCIKKPRLSDFAWDSMEKVTEKACLTEKVLSDFHRGIIDQYALKLILLSTSKQDPKTVLNSLHFLSREVDQLAALVALLCIAPLESMRFLETFQGFKSAHCNTILAKHVDNVLIQNRLNWRNHYLPDEIPLLEHAKAIEALIVEEKLDFKAVESFRRQFELFVDSLNIPQLFIVLRALSKIPLEQRKYRAIRLRFYVLIKQIMKNENLIAKACQPDLYALEGIESVTLPNNLLEKLLITQARIYPKKVLAYIESLANETLVFNLWAALVKEMPWMALCEFERKHTHQVYQDTLKIILGVDIHTVLLFASHSPSVVLENIQEFSKLSDQDILDVINSVCKTHPKIFLQNVHHIPIFEETAYERSFQTTVLDTLETVLEMTKCSKAKHEYMLELQEIGIVWKSEKVALRYLRLLKYVSGQSKLVWLSGMKMPGHIKAKVLSGRFGLSHFVRDRTLSFMDLDDNGITDDRILHQGICYAWALMLITQDVDKLNPVLVEQPARFYQAWLLLAHETNLPRRLLDKMGLILTKKSLNYCTKDLKNPGILCATIDAALKGAVYDGVVLVMVGKKSSHAIYIHPKKWILIDQNCRDLENNPKVIRSGSKESFFEGLFYHLQTRSDLYHTVYFEAYLKNLFRPSTKRSHLHRIIESTAIC